MSFLCGDFCLSQELPQEPCEEAQVGSDGGGGESSGESFRGLSEDSGPASPEAIAESDLSQSEEGTTEFLAIHICGGPLGPPPLPEDIGYDAGFKAVEERRYDDALALAYSALWPFSNEVVHNSVRFSGN